MVWLHYIGVATTSYTSLQSTVARWCCCTVKLLHLLLMQLKLHSTGIHIQYMQYCSTSVASIVSYGRAIYGDHSNNDRKVCGRSAEIL